MRWRAEPLGRDSALRGALRDFEDAELRLIDWNRLANRIVEAVRQSAQASAWYEVMSRWWWSVGLPLAFAAGVGALVALGALSPGRTSEAGVADAPNVVDLLVLRQTGSELRDAVLGFSDVEAFLTDALGAGR